MFLLHEYDIFWAFLIISSVIPILAFLISSAVLVIRSGKFPWSFEQEWYKANPSC